MLEMPQIDLEKCDLCGLCATVCACGAIVIAGNIITITDTADCAWCTWCEAVCPHEAITCSFEIVFDDRS